MAAAASSHRPHRRPIAMEWLGGGAGRRPVTPRARRITLLDPRRLFEPPAGGVSREPVEPSIEVTRASTAGHCHLRAEGRSGAGLVAPAGSLTRYSCASRAAVARVGAFIYAAHHDCTPARGRGIPSIWALPRPRQNGARPGPPTRARAAGRASLIALRRARRQRIRILYHKDSKCIG